MDDATMMIASLKEAVGKMATDYETRIAEMRVSFTKLSQECDRLKAALEEFRLAEEQVPHEPESGKDYLDSSHTEDELETWRG